ncbi:MAG: flagellar filament capping protein FliD [Desulfocucumaceae bacterium]
MSQLRIGGLATGMDIDQMVKDLMRAQRMKSDRVKQKRQQVEWQRTDFRTLNNSLRALRDAAFNMELEGPYLAKKATSSNEVAVAATAGTTSAVGSFTVNVDWLATGVTRGSQLTLGEETNIDGTVKTLAAQFGITGTKTFTLEGKLVDGVPKSHTFNIDTSTYTINTLVTEINNADLGITASYDSTANRFYLTTTGVGSDYGIRVVNDADFFMSDATGAGTGTLKLLIQNDGARISGQDAQYDFGDVNNISSKTNTFAINGITLTIKAAGASTVTVARDADAVYNSIKSFIDQYNTTIDLINKELTEERYRDYTPLTDEQREQLSDKQEEDWEAKAKSGMLRNDSYLTGVVGKMRAAMSSVVSGIPSVSVGGQTVTHNSLASVGIVTGYYTEGGKLYLEKDGATLKEAIQNDPDGVMKLFNNASTVAEEKGISRRLYDNLYNAVNEIIDKAGAESTFSLRDDSVFGKKLYDLDEQILTWEDRLVDIENRYWRQFTAMEKAINQMNSQSAWLAQQFGTGQ